MPKLNHSHIYNKSVNLIRRIDPIRVNGKVTQVIGLTIEAKGPAVSLGEVCIIESRTQNQTIYAEVVGFKHDKVLLMPLSEIGSISPGSQVIPTGKPFNVKVGFELLGSVLDGLGRPIDESSIPDNLETYSVNNTPPNPLSRPRITQPLSVGVRSIDALHTVGKGQRIGLFAGSGVGKSTLLGMIARNTEADVNVIALIGERGREVREFIDKDLGPEGLKKSVLIVATSDQPALVRMKGALLATAVAEYFRDQGKQVMLMMDSLTRYAMAGREVGLAVGEPPAARGYTPSVFATLPRLLERAGTSATGSITAFYTVLVDADDMNEPIADAVRGILDGHIVLSRKLAHKGHYPAIDVLQSVSRVMNDISDKEHLEVSNRLKELLAIYRESEDLISIGAYKKGSNRKLDIAIQFKDRIDQFCQQQIYEKTTLQESIDSLTQLIRE
ncbi:flagellar protein export ATPase FliI [Desulfuribacillus alkaliarsenatis]|uniref:Type 3 secretion system ATPase n=1 Tax=Desulfuribacillus alkaliarsenatis TaxID=766136 RepID=A0A1E5G5X5_9FIRM|nr:flagellar protein export ATPase FliI [Desulfuribacillus alkaliarsenatis]OEF98607.1 flagellum-specific ATP synthase FliI [Desulfuribacillus alkaliarsenatis]